MKIIAEKFFVLGEVKETGTWQMLVEYPKIETVHDFLKIAKHSITFQEKYLSYEVHCLKIFDNGQSSVTALPILQSNPTNIS